MSIFHKIREIISHVPKKALVLSGIAAAIAVPIAVGAYGPERSTFTIEKPADYITFNSITNNPHLGDERNFVMAREDDGKTAPNTTWSPDSIKVEKGKSYVVTMYVHNNAAANLNLVAQNVRAMADVPTTTGKQVTVTGIISADNASPKKVWDEVAFTSGNDFNLAIDWNYGVHYENNGMGNTVLSNKLFSNTGALLGYSAIDGKIPGCFQYDGYVTFKVTPQFAEIFDFDVSKQVSAHGAKKWAETYEAKPGELVDFRVDYINVSGERQDNVTLRDNLPKGLTVESVRWYNLNTGEWQEAVNDITTTGINIGSYIDAGTQTRAELTVKVPEEDDLVCGVNTFNNVGSVHVNGYRKDDGATVTVNKECKPEPVEVFTCDALHIDRIGRTEFNFTTDYTIRNVTFEKVTYVIGANNYAVTNTDTKYAYNQNVAGTYNVHAFVTVKTADGSANSNLCTGTLTVDPPDVEKCTVPGKEHLDKDDPECKEKPYVPVTPNDPKGYTPTEIPETGAGVLGLLGLGGLTTSLGYYLTSRRKLRGM